MKTLRYSETAGMVYLEMLSLIPEIPNPQSHRCDLRTVNNWQVTPDLVSQGRRAEYCRSVCKVRKTYQVGLRLQQIQVWIYLPLHFLPATGRPSAGWYGVSPISAHTRSSPPPRRNIKSAARRSINNSASLHPTLRLPLSLLPFLALQFVLLTRRYSTRLTAISNPGVP